MSEKKIAVTVGILFIVQMATAMVGTSLIQAFIDGNRDRAPLTAGVLLMVCSGLAVVGIGFLMYQVLKDVNEKVARCYPTLRLTEFAVSTFCGVYLLIQLQVVPTIFCGSTFRPGSGAWFSTICSGFHGWFLGPSPCSAWSAMACSRWECP